jgi:hypothetical protein
MGRETTSNVHLAVYMAQTTIKRVISTWLEEKKYTMPFFVGW